MKELIAYIARSLVDDPTQVDVSVHHHRSNVNLKLQVAPQDMGRVIGKNGRVANAMRSLLQVSAAQMGKKASLDIVEPR
jgi:hypothetical protein